MNVPVATDDGVELQTRVAGSGPTLVLCHGGPGLWDYLDDLTALLQDPFTVWTYDQRGCGRSGGRSGPHTVARFVADLDAVRAATGEDRVVVVGHSWGAMLALLYASGHPDRVKGLVYIAGVGIEWPKWKPLHDEESRRRIDRPPISGAVGTLRGFVGIAGDFVDPLLGLQRARAFATSGHEVNADCSRALNIEVDGFSEEEWQRRCRQVTAPVLVIQGENDPRPIDSVDSMVAALPRVRRVVLEAGHFPWVEQPDAVRELVTTFARER